MIVDTNTLPLLLTIADRACAADAARRSVRTSADNLNDAYTAWKAERGIDRVERDTADWQEMMSATTTDYQTLESVKRQERNARKRLQSSIAQLDRARRGDAS